jgi:rhamnosyltransferase subunit B
MDERRGPEEIVRFMLQYLPQMYGDYERAINADGGADLLITSDLAYAGPILAEKTGINWASQVLSPLSFLSAYDESVLPPLPWLWRLKALGPRAYGAILGLARHAARRLSAEASGSRRSATRSSTTSIPRRWCWRCSRDSSANRGRIGLGRRS